MASYEKAPQPDMASASASLSLLALSGLGSSRDSVHLCSATSSKSSFVKVEESGLLLQDDSPGLRAGAEAGMRPTTARHTRSSSLSNRSGTPTAAGLSAQHFSYAASKGNSSSLTFSELSLGADLAPSFTHVTVTASPYEDVPKEVRLAQIMQQYNRSGAASRLRPATRTHGPPAYPPGTIKTHRVSSRQHHGSRCGFEEPMVCISLGDDDQQDTPVSSSTPKDAHSSLSRAGSAPACVGDSLLGSGFPLSGGSTPTAAALGRPPRHHLDPASVASSLRPAFSTPAQQDSCSSHLADQNLLHGRLGASVPNPLLWSLVMGAKRHPRSASCNGRSSRANQLLLNSIHEAEEEDCPQLVAAMRR